MLVVIVGGGPGGAAAACKLAQEGVETLLIEKSFSRIKPCAGVIPSELIREFDIPDHLIERRIETLTASAPSGNPAQLSIPNSYLGVISRETFDHFLRTRAAEAGAMVVEARVDSVEATERAAQVTITLPDGKQKSVMPDCIIGADGANSFIARKFQLNVGGRFAATLQERFNLDTEGLERFRNRAELFFDSRVSPDFFGWVIAKAEHVTVGVASTVNDVDLNQHLMRLKDLLGITEAPFLHESANIPLQPHRHWVANRIALIGDAAGLAVAGTGEGIYYAMKSGIAAAAGIIRCNPDFREEKLEAAYQKPFLRMYGELFQTQEVLRGSYYHNDEHREALIAMLQDETAQRLLLDAYFHQRSKRVPFLTALKLKAKHTYHLSKVKMGHYKTRTEG
ncbi:MAG: geranylgeranyl diphosphate reductase [Blastocatellia bacterium]|nr:geranylgeranyl diphosphate reductase [Blastocatellia bacterium]